MPAKAYIRFPYAPSSGIVSNVSLFTLVIMLSILIALSIMYMLTNSKMLSIIHNSI